MSPDQPRTSIDDFDDSGDKDGSAAEGGTPTRTGEAEAADNRDRESPS